MSKERLHSLSTSVAGKKVTNRLLSQYSLVLAEIPCGLRIWHLQVRQLPLLVVWPLRELVSKVSRLSRILARFYPVPYLGYSNPPMTFDFWVS